MSDEMSKLQTALIVLTKKYEESIKKNAEVENFLNKQDKEIEKLNVLFEQVDSNGGGSGGTVEINNETLGLKIKENLLNDEELLETFSNIIKNVQTFNDKKEKVDAYTDKKQFLKNKNKKKIPYIIVSIVILSFVLVGFYFLTAEKKEFKKGTIFYIKDNQYTFSEDVKADLIDEDKYKIYFMLNDQKCYIKKPSANKSN